ncbi:MAG: hypothetical protein H7Z21_18505 [Hymenobacter sp.]|nr:hypothetical protein [Hymenobacter sp.]
MATKTETTRPDLVVYSTDQKPRLIVELKAATRLRSSETGWLSAVHQHYSQPGCYFLIVTPETLLLWLPDAESGAEPAFAVDAEQVLAGRLDTQRFPLSRLSGQELESVVYSWLLFTLFKSAQELLADPNQRWLVQSGLHALIYQGDVMRQAA